MPEWIWVYDVDTETESAIFESQLPHGNYELIEGASALDANGEPRPPVRRAKEFEAPSGPRTKGAKPAIPAALDADDNKE